MTNRIAARYPAFDALRTTMMLLGLVVHSAVSYQVEPLRECGRTKPAAGSGTGPRYLAGISVTFT